MKRHNKLFDLAAHYRHVVCLHKRHAVQREQKENKRKGKKRKYIQR